MKYQIGSYANPCKQNVKKEVPVFIKGITDGPIEHHLDHTAGIFCKLKKKKKASACKLSHHTPAYPTLPALSISLHGSSSGMPGLGNIHPKLLEGLCFT